MRFPALFFGLLCVVGCAKKEPKPMRTEPWLAHPPARASASSDAALPFSRYLIGERSRVRFEIPTKRGTLSGTLSAVSGELNLNLADLTQSRGLVRAELGSLEIHAGAGASVSDALLLERARAALELSADPGAKATFASFELTAVEDPSPPLIEAAPAGGATTATSRSARFTAVGNLLLHGFRVVRRTALSAEFGFNDAERVPQSVLIRSRAPFVVSLETHAIVTAGGDSRTNIPAETKLQAREARVTVELYGTKID